MALSHICAHLFHHKISNRSHSLLCTDANTFSQNIKMGCLKFTQQTFDDIPHHDTSHSYDIPRDTLAFMAYIILYLTLHLQHNLLHHDKPHAAATYFAPFCAIQIAWDSKQRSYFIYAFFHLLFWALLTCLWFLQTHWRCGYHVCKCTCHLLMKHHHQRSGYQSGCATRFPKKGVCLNSYCKK